MLAYQFQQEIPATHRVTIELPPDAPTGEQAQIIVLFPTSRPVSAGNVPDFASLWEFTTWLQTQPPTGRTTEEITQQIRDERDGWE